MLRGGVRWRDAVPTRGCRREIWPFLRLFWCPELLCADVEALLTCLEEKAAFRTAKTPMLNLAVIASAVAASAVATVTDIKAQMLQIAALTDREKTIMFTYSHLPSPPPTRVPHTHT